MVHNSSLSPWPWSSHIQHVCDVNLIILATILNAVHILDPDPSDCHPWMFVALNANTDSEHYTHCCQNHFSDLRRGVTDSIETVCLIWSSLSDRMVSSHQPNCCQSISEHHAMWFIRQAVLQLTLQLNSGIICPELLTPPSKFSYCRSHEFATSSYSAWQQWKQLDTETRVSEIVDSIIVKLQVHSLHPDVENCILETCCRDVHQSWDQQILDC